jgi:hypothetical protein
MRLLFFSVLYQQIVQSDFGSPKKRPSYSRPAAFPWSEWGKLRAENNLDLKAIGDHPMRCKSAVFWQSERYNTPVSTRTETDGFAGLSGTGPDPV